MTERLTVRFEPETFDAIDEQVEAGEAASRSAFVRRAVETFLAELEAEADLGWEDELLNRAYRALLDVGADMGDRVVLEADHALSVVADRTNTPKDAVKSAVFARLARQGRLAVVFGRVWVAKPELLGDVEEPEAVEA